MVFNDILIEFSKPLIPYVAWVLTGFIGLMLGGIIVKSGNGWGKIIGSDLFQSKKKQFLFIIIEVVGILVGAIYLQKLLEYFLFVFSDYLIAIIIEFFIIFYIWFLHRGEYDIKNSRVAIIISEIITIFLIIIIYF